MEERQYQAAGEIWQSPWTWAGLAVASAVTIYLLVAHAEHVLPFLPYGLLLLCPLMHIFMMRGGHGGHGGHGGSGDPGTGPTSGRS